MDPVILVFAGLAAFVIFRLLSVLGTRTGHEQRHDLEGVQRAARAREPVSEPAAEEASAPAGAPVSEAAQPLRAADPAFDERSFLDGARSAYEMIVEAFAAGDLRSIRSFLSQSVYDAFKSAMSDQESKGYKTELQFVGIDRAAIISSKVVDGTMQAVTEFASNQVRVTRDQAGNVVEGDPTRIDLVKDRWTFARKIGSGDPNWVLVATGGAS